METRPYIELLLLVVCGPPWPQELRLGRKRRLINATARQVPSKSSFLEKEDWRG